MKHTPGPWQVWDGPAYVGGGRDLCIGAGEEWLANVEHRVCKRYACHVGACGVEHDTSLATCGCEETITEEQMANARLIAAAPDLLTVLREIIEGAGRPYWEAKAKAAIAKAEGK